MVANKEDWQYELSARCLQLAIEDLSKAWKNFFDKAQVDWGKPRFKSKKAPRQGFKTDRAKIINGKLRLDKTRGIKKWYDTRFKGAKSLGGELKGVSIYRENGKYWASLPFEVNTETKPKTNHVTAVDVNVSHINYTEGKVNTLLDSLKQSYKRIKYYQRMLARKRAGKSVLFLLESNPGPGLGVLLALTFFGKGNAKGSAPGATFIQFIGGIHNDILTLFEQRDQKTLQSELAKRFLKEIKVGIPI